MLKRAAVAIAMGEAAKGETNVVYELRGVSQYLATRYRFHVSRHDDDRSLWFEIRYEDEQREMGKHLNTQQVRDLVAALQQWLQAVDEGAAVPAMCAYCVSRKGAPVGECALLPGDGHGCTHYVSAYSDPEEPQALSSRRKARLH